MADMTFREILTLKNNEKAFKWHFLSRKNFNELLLNNEKTLILKEILNGILYSNLDFEYLSSLWYK